MTGTIHNSQPKLISINIGYSLSPNGTYSANLKTLIDAEMPSGYHYVAIAEYALNDARAVVTNMFYGDSPYSLYLENISSATVVATLVLGFLIARD